MDNKEIFKVPAYEDVTADAQLIFDQLKKISGKVPNLYATIGYSGNALSSYMAFVQAQAKGSFHAKDREAIFLIISELNGCQYCLSAHTQSALKNHWTEEETMQLRSGTIPDNKWKAIYLVIQSVIQHKGEVSDEILHAFFECGYDNAALMDLLILINVMTFTNHVYRLTKIPIDFPLAKPLIAT
ncbi:carboxymuconolactone decarboxylase family protein [Mucilaginibacter sp.]|uniref:carboxymuconolactone decarboxylase family protein n=1 Tax=Mucilaginibacter sp. TaxID=1882438 RepID=UPI002624CE39|nr:carboxymuconolactone decarboxylase family protein [Mucilaginibacter sp.]MDB5032525.1 carboxymuconolactone decarboxylase family protein [Mucilaginibacter sp.]